MKLRLLALLLLVPSVSLAAPAPDIAVSVNNGPLIDADVTLSITLDNTDATDTGFYPYFRFVLPPEWDFVSANCDPYPLATPASEIGPAPSNTNVTDPVTGELVALTTGERMITVVPGVGQITPNQPTVTCEFDLTPSGTPDQTLFVANTIRDIRGIFGLGDAPSNAFGTCSSGDTACSAANTQDITPNLISINKGTTQPSLTATGPSYPFNFTINGNLAAGETLNNVTISDSLPAEVWLVSADPGDCSTFAISPAPTTCVYTPNDPFNPDAGGDIDIAFATLSSDFSVSIPVFVPFSDNFGAPLLNLNTGANESASNTVTVDADEFGAPIVDTANFAVNGMDIAKSSSIANDVDGNGLTPGDTIEWTVSFVVSDYFDVENITITDIIGDGHTYVADSMNLAITENGSTLNLDEVTVEADTASYIDDTYSGVTGETTLDVDISAILDDEDLNPGQNGQLEGNLTGQAKVVMTYETLVQNDFVVNPGGDPSIDAGDTLTNDVDIDYDVVGGDTGINRSANDSQVVRRIIVLTKELIKINGADPLDDPAQVQGGDVVTYQLNIEIPAGDVEDLVITDYLPKPLFDVPGTMTYNAAADATTPPATGEWGVELNDTSLSINGTFDPTISTTNNSLAWDFGSFDDPTGDTKTISFVFSVTATFEPIQNGLQQVNVANATYNDSEASAEVPAIGTVKLVGLAPEINVTKSASITSGDAGDTITYTIEIDNVGDRTAFDLVVQDVLPTDGDGNLLLAPSNPSNCDEDAGTAGIPDCDYNFTESAACSDITSPDFSGSDETQISIDGFSVEAGDTCTLTYDVVVSSTAKLGQEIENEVVAFFDNESGGTAAPFPPEDDSADLFTLDDPNIEKDNNPAAATQIVEIGDTIMFDVTLTIPEGTMKNAVFIDLERNAGGGQQDWWGNPSSVTVSGGLTGAGPFCLTTDANICFENDPTNMANWDTSDSDSFEIDLGDITNAATDDTVRTATFTLTGLVNTNATEGLKRNRARIQWDDPNGGGTLNDTSANNSAASAEVQINGPDIDVVKCTDTASTDEPIAMTDGADEAKYRIMLANVGDSTAFQVSDITDTLPLGLFYDNAGSPAVAYYCDAGASSINETVCRTWDPLNGCSGSITPVTGSMTVDADGAYAANATDQQDLSFSVTDGSGAPSDEIVNDGYFIVEFGVTVNCDSVVDNTGSDSPSTGGGTHPDTDGFDNGCVASPDVAVANFSNNFTNTATVASYNSQPSGNPNGQTYGPEDDDDTLTRDDDNDGFTNAQEGSGDNDSDGVPNYLDTDSDNNGIDDMTEGGMDNDGDGTADYLDLDDDNDGINDGDEIEYLGGEGVGDMVDTDMDGTEDFRDPDSDNDGIEDGSEADADSDGDGSKDYVDFDSDNDGIPDYIEYGLGSLDANTDGEIDAGELPFVFDTDSNGAIELSEMTDVYSSGNGVLPDFDGDGTIDALDLDSDNDGLPDVDEAGTTVSNKDINNDNEITEAERTAGGEILFADIVNSDNDAAGTYGDAGDGYRPNYLDIDSDNDGVADLVENGRESCDGDNNGEITSAEGNACGLNGNGDDFVFASESAPTNTDSGAAGELTSDTDPDYIDRDSDGDGIADWIEAHTNDNIDPAVDDYDGDDGTTDGYIENEAFLITDSSNLTNTDGADVADVYDNDSDEDGFEDYQESGSAVADYVSTPGTPAYDTSTPVTLYANLFNGDYPDADNAPNFRDLDGDGDGIADGSEGLTDTDQDGLPNYLDRDSDNDGIPDYIEYGLGTLDTNNDGSISASEINASGLDTIDNDTLTVNELTTEYSDTAGALPDTDGDGTIDAFDLDSDNDGLPDIDEAGTVISALDVNNDNEITDAERTAIAGGEVLFGNVANADLEAQGTYGPTGDAYRPNYLDIDSDNDGVADVVENGRESCDTNNDGFIADAEGGACGLNTDADNYVFASESTPINTDGAAGGNLTSDTVPDYADKDSDGDGIADWIEAHSNDNIDPSIDDYDGDNNGEIENEGLLIIDSTNLVNTDGAGEPDMLDTDSDDDGLDDYKESGASVVDYTTTPGTPVYDTSTPIALYAGLFNTDASNDNEPNFRDLDSDNDTIEDSVEGSSGPTDVDGDGIPDFMDNDADNDGITDMEEITNGGGGTPASPVDTDGDGTADYLDADSDNDGIADATEDSGDTDGDGEDDYQDLDSDNDGIPDNIEYGLGAYDTNNDGVLSNAERIASGLDVDSSGAIEEDELTTVQSDTVAALPDADADGTPNALDLDSDNDGLPDIDEAGALVSDLDANDDNQITETERGALGGDGVVNLDDLANNDADTGSTFGPAGDAYAPDLFDRDSDDDGIADLIENGRESCDTNNDGFITDAEGGTCGLNTDADNYVFASESPLPNSDDAMNLLSFTDVTPDYIDRDSDGDGIADWIEAHSNDNIDTTVDNYDGDDGTTDGYVSNEAFLVTDSSNLVNTDGTGAPDYLDTDADGDSILDAQESGTTVVDYTAVPGGPHVYQTSNELVLYADVFSTDSAEDNELDFRDLDSDDDGVTDTVEKGMGSDPVDTELDGVPDFQDLDSDEDGLSDEDETAEGTDRTNEDSDGDTCGDGCEVFGSNNGGATKLTCFLSTSTDPVTIAEIPGSVGNFVTDPNDADTDDGGVNDCIEAANDLDPLTDPDDDGDVNLDPDMDGLTDGEETFNLGSDPNDATTTNDPGCSGVAGCVCHDGCKVFGNIPAGCPFDHGPHDAWYMEGTYTVDAPYLDPTDTTNDADSDGCSDCFEGAVTLTNPHDDDTDGDTLGDCQEFQQNLNPLVTDTDGDGCSDTCEVFGIGPDCDVSDQDWFTASDYNITNPLSDPLSDADADDDEVSDCEEIQTHQSNPNNEDTDGGGIPDGLEINTFQSDPLDPLDDCPNTVDSDGDGLTDCEEIDAGTDPFDASDVRVQGSGSNGLFLLGCRSTAPIPWLWMLGLVAGWIALRRKEWYS